VEHGGDEVLAGAGLLLGEGRAGAGLALEVHQVVAVVLLAFHHGEPVLAQHGVHLALGQEDLGLLQPGHKAQRALFEAHPSLLQQALL
jgi:hypothetical protein